MRLIRLALFLLMIGPAAAAGQASVSLGATFPLGPERIDDAYAAGLGLWGAFGLSRSYIVKPRVIAGFDVIRTDKEFLREVGEDLGVKVEGGDLSTIFAGFDALLVSPLAAIRPYIAPGIGYAIISVDEFTVGNVPFENLQSEQAFAAIVTVGAAVRLGGGPHLLVEARLVRAFAERDAVTWMPVNVGVFFDLD